MSQRCSVLGAKPMLWAVQYFGEFRFMKSNLDDQQGKRPIASVTVCGEYVLQNARCSKVPRNSERRWEPGKCFASWSEIWSSQKHQERAGWIKPCAKRARHYGEFSQQCLVTWRKLVKKGRWVNGFCVSWAKSTNVHTGKPADIRPSDFPTIRFMEEFFFCW